MKSKNIYVQMLLESEARIKLDDVKTKFGVYYLDFNSDVNTEPQTTEVELDLDDEEGTKQIILTLADEFYESCVSLLVGKGEEKQNIKVSGSLKNSEGEVLSDNISIVYDEIDFDEVKAKLTNDDFQEEDEDEKEEEEDDFDKMMKDYFKREKQDREDEEYDREIRGW